MNPLQRRRLLLGAAAGAAAGLSLDSLALAAAASSSAAAARRLAGMPTRQVEAGVLDVGYHQAGPENGHPVILLHGFPYDIHSYAEVAPRLAAQGYRVIVPYLRGHGSTRFLDPATPRAGQQAALGQDVIDLMDALHIPEAVLAGYDWGGRAACVAAAMKPTRCVGLVAVNGYLIQDIGRAATPAPAPVEAGLWYQYYFLTERGRAGLTANRAAIARVLWKHNSPAWRFDDASFARAARAFDNPDYVDVVLHAYRHRLGQAAGYPDYEETEALLAAQPVIKSPAITLDGLADGLLPATDGRADAARFSGPRQHRQIPGAGHNLPQEAPRAFADAVAALARGGKWRT
ncbi:pimeloyl-ACP methyl ester carboxylesterase [Duganella sp. 1224]|uniref:alpha/beta fold hydrolase n=1 Tax=Duganella sp. 1224 TaxID=2587052 RepID=UPI0015CDCB91|nr:alpha/beta hydrolase [Duganella sp. 1224]NYE62931.1 pimeloyl-ACP methyl ester carboxylesterase [Duganella sp. 1224]